MDDPLTSRKYYPDEEIRQQREHWKNETIAEKDKAYFHYRHRHEVVNFYEKAISLLEESIEDEKSKIRMEYEDEIERLKKDNKELEKNIEETT